MSFFTVLFVLRLGALFMLTLNLCLQALNMTLICQQHPIQPLAFFSFLPGTLTIRMSA